MSHWRDFPLVGLDTETTGTDPETARIVTACVGWASPTAHTWSPVNWLLKQDQPIPDEAAAIHGITTEQANAHGMDHQNALSEIARALRQYWERGWPVVAYNAVYDLTVINRECRRHGIEFEVTGPVIDPLVVDKAVDKYRRGSRKLIDVAAHYGITLDADQAHGAEADALAATRLAWKLGPQLPADLREAFLLQREWYADQRQSFAEYLRKQGKTDDADQVASRISWPLEPAPARAAA